MKIESYISNLGEIFNCINSETPKYDEFIIPGYQRPYEWAEEQVKTALESIEIGLNDVNEPLLFGTIHLNKKGDNAFEIIDGQQRLTTFYLILRALGKDIKFCPKNEINKNIETQLARATDSLDKNSYSENYWFIKKYFDDTLKEAKDDYKKALLGFIVEKVTFVVIETQDNDSIEKTLQIFDSLNTTGLSLDVKDVFKIKIRDYLQKSNAENDTDLFEKINNAYNTVKNIDAEGSPYFISEDDLIETFKLYLIGKENLEYPAEKLKMSNQKFFEDVFKRNNKNVNIETFVGIANSIEKSQILLSEKDKKIITANDISLFAKELLNWSGYSKLKNVLYLFVYCQCKEREPNKSQIDNALKLTELVWKFCSIYRTVTTKVLNGVFNFIGENVINKVSDDNFIWNDKIFDEIKKVLSDAIADKKIDSRIEEFSDILNGNIFDNSRKDFFMALSYIDDAVDVTAIEIKKTLFYRNKWDLDIEHIASRSLYDNDEKHNIINSLGNLLYLERKINRSLGTDTKEKNREEDLKNKQTKYCEYNWKSKNKKGSELKSVESLYKKHHFQNWNVSNIHDEIEERKNLKLKFLKSVYEDIGIFSGK